MLKWSAWKKFKGRVHFTDSSLTETLEEGQAFRWKKEADGIWLGQWSNHIARVKLNAKGELQWQCPDKFVAKTEKAINAYFNSDLDYDKIIDSLPWRSDPILKSAMDLYPGMRILKQEAGETLFIFLCSSSKHIKQIKEMCELTADNYGNKVAENYRAIPDWKTLNKVSEDDLRKCKLGYRAKYIKGTAEAFAKEPNFLKSLEKLSYEDAREKLITLSGVGEKIADCMLLYGMGRMESFPVDTWVCKVMSKLYGLEGWKLPQIATFGRTHFGEYAGLAQQFLFTAHRRGKI